MGAIQGSINNMLGTVAAGVALGKHAVEQKEAKLSQALSDASSVGEETVQNLESTEKAEAENKKLNKEWNALADLRKSVKTDEDEEAWDELYEGLNNRQDKSILVERKLKAEQEAIKHKSERANKILEKFGYKIGGKK